MEKRFQYYRLTNIISLSVVRCQTSILPTNIGRGGDLKGTAGDGPLLNLRWGTALVYVPQYSDRVSSNTFQRQHEGLKKVIMNFGWRNRNLGLKEDHSVIWLKIFLDTPVIRFVGLPKPRAKPPPLNIGYVYLTTHRYRR